MDLHFHMSLFAQGACACHDSWRWPELATNSLLALQQEPAALGSHNLAPYCLPFLRPSSLSHPWLFIRLGIPLPFFTENSPSAGSPPHFILILCIISSILMTSVIAKCISSSLTSLLNLRPIYLPFSWTSSCGYSKGISSSK